MMLTKRLLSGVLFACCFGALACSDDPATSRTDMDAGISEPEDESEDEFEDDDDEPRARPKDAGTKRDAGKDAGRDAGRDAATTTRPRGIDSGAGQAPTSGGGDGEGPTVVDTERDPTPGASAGGGEPSLRDTQGNPAYKTAQCAPGLGTGSGTSVPLWGCCLQGGTCGLQRQNVEFANRCSTLDEVRDYYAGNKAVTIAYPDPATCEYGRSD